MVQTRLERPTNRSNPLPVPSMVLSTLRVLAKGDFQSEAADIHGISQPSFSRTFMDVIDALNYSLRNINFPSGQADILQIKEDFLKVSNFPNVVGAIDGTLIPIIGMSGDDEHVFVSRKGFHAINMQGIVTADLKFTNIVCKYGGATHDAFILANSSIPEMMEQLPGGGWLLGDSGYPLRPWLMTPILAPQARQEEKFNKSHIKTRNCVERAFGVLKSRFRQMSAQNRRSFGIHPCKVCQDY
ncbi:putative nuclease HARBI1 isoform X2 [Saccostrea cucullata]|uniref:putative nuclease HARBI1 isoform X2 n=1 Tax=Saccostrea cuccullata TaxID=36930 RepID=UPI002ED3C44D